MIESLDKACVYNAKLTGDEFVGIRIEDGIPRVYFPVGYRKSTDSREIKRDILNLISVLSMYERKDITIQTEHDERKNKFPIHAYIGVFTYYLNHGYFTENESTYKIAKSGKIDWSRTIKSIRPQISNESPVYLDFVVKKSRVNEEHTITQIHKYCVYESYQKIGCIFSSAKPEKPSIKFNEKLFTSVLLSKIANSFNESHLILFRQMLDIVKSLGKSNNKNSAFFGTNEFEYVWEKLIDHVYGISKDQKKEFYPNTQWFIEGNGDIEVDQELEKSALRPDTIMLYPKDGKQEVYVLDAKYYRYGAKRVPAFLPGTGSINKQFTYAEYVKTLDRYKKVNVYNAFIMPYDANLPEGTVDLRPKRIGFATGSWKSKNETHEKIYGILLDIKSIMHQHTRLSSKDMEKLAELIK
jgi:hypothetical protein